MLKSRRRNKRDPASNNKQQSRREEPTNSPKAVLWPPQVYCEACVSTHTEPHTLGLGTLYVPWWPLGHGQEQLPNSLLYRLLGISLTGLVCCEPSQVWLLRVQTELFPGFFCFFTLTSALEFKSHFLSARRSVPVTAGAPNPAPSPLPPQLRALALFMHLFLWWAICSPLS